MLVLRDVVMVMVILMTVAMKMTMTMRCAHKDSKQNRWRSSKFGKNRNARQVDGNFLQLEDDVRTTGRTVLWLDMV